MRGTSGWSLPTARPPGANRTLGTSSQVHPTAEPRTNRIAPTRVRQEQCVGVPHMSPCDNSACPCNALAAAAPAVGQPSGAPESHSVPEPGARAPARPSGMRLRACLERSPTIAAPCPPPGTRHTQSGARTKMRSAIPAQCSKRSAGFYPTIIQQSQNHYRSANAHCFPGPHRQD